MDFLNDTEGTVLFPFQTEIAFVLAIITTAKDLSVSAWGGTSDRNNTGAPVSVFGFWWLTWDSVPRWSGL